MDVCFLQSAHFWLRGDERLTEISELALKILIDRISERAEIY